MEAAQYWKSVFLGLYSRSLFYIVQAVYYLNRLQYCVENENCETNKLEVPLSWYEYALEILFQNNSRDKILVGDNLKPVGTRTIYH